MKKKVFIISSIILCLILVLVILVNYYNVVIFVQNSSPTDNCIDINIMCDNETLVIDTFKYSQITPNYKMFFAHVAKGEHQIKARSNKAAFEKCKSFYFSRKRTYLIVDYQFWQVIYPNDKMGDTSKIIETFEKKQFDIGITTKRFKFQ